MLAAARAKGLRRLAGDKQGDAARWSAACRRAYRSATSPNSPLRRRRIATLRTRPQMNGAQFMRSFDSARPAKAQRMVLAIPIRPASDQRLERGRARSCISRANSGRRSTAAFISSALHGSLGERSRRHIEHQVAKCSRSRSTDNSGRKSRISRSAWARVRGTGSASRSRAMSPLCGEIAVLVAARHRRLGVAPPAVEEIDRAGDMNPGEQPRIGRAIGRPVAKRPAETCS